jgi:ABC-type oligopeptide transport system ATPase subunit
VSIQAQIVNLLGELQERLALSYVFVAHDLAVVRHLSTEIAVMYLGRIVEQAPTAELFARPLHPYTQALLAAIPAPDPRRYRVAPGEGGEGSPEKEGSRRRLPLASEPLEPPDAAAAAQEALGPVIGCAFEPRCPCAIAACKKETPQLAPREATGPSHRIACHLSLEDAMKAGEAALRP